MGAVIIGMGVLAGYALRSRGGSTPANTTASPDCALSDQSYVPVSALPSFQPMVDNKFDTLPFRQGDGGGFLKGRLKGSIASIAVNGPDRAAIDQHSTALHYQIGKFPLVPLQGPVVEHNPGPLEWYETHMLFDDVNSAAAWMKINSNTSVSFEAGTTSSPYPVLFGDESFGAQDIPSPPSVQMETRDWAMVRIGNVVLSYSLQGGSGLTASTITPYLQQGMAQYQAACGRLAHT